MSTEENKAVARRYFAALNAVLDGRDPATLGESDLAVFDEIGTPEFAARAKPFISGAYRLWGDHHVEVTDMLAEGNQVWARLATGGGHTGEWKGIAPTGKRWTNTGVFFLRFADGKIAETSGLFDALNHLQQLGATVTPPRREQS